MVSDDRAPFPWCRGLTPLGWDSAFGGSCRQSRQDAQPLASAELSPRGPVRYGRGMTPRYTLLAVGLLSMLAGCSRTDNDPGPGGVTRGEAEALDRAAQKLEARQAAADQPGGVDAVAQPDD